MPRPTTPRLSPDAIRRAGLEIIDADGLEELSMRRLADRLGVRAASLYNHVRTKDELIALMDDAIMSEALIPAEEFPTHWYDALAAVAERTWDVLMRHPWALRSLQNAPIGPNAMRHFEQSLAALADTGLAAPAKFALVTAVDDYVHGNVFRVAEFRATATPPEDRGAAEAAARFAETQYATGEFPHLQA